MRTLILLLALSLLAPVTAAAQRTEGNFVERNFHFESGDSLSELRIHYVTLGQPHRDAEGIVRNAVLMLHGTTGSGTGLVRPMSALFAPGAPLDTTTHYVIFPDGIGHGQSSKPSDGLRMQFPQYTYNDMVDAQHRLLVEGLHVNHLRLVMGTSMGCMHSWVWGERYPGFADGLVPLACAPTEIAGRNRMVRELIINDIESDPDWKDGSYDTPLMQGMRAAMGVLFVMTSAPLVQQRQAPTRVQADSQILAYINRHARSLDANDVIYAFEASRFYNPSAHLDAITVPVLAINSADDFVNPPELGLMKTLMPRVKHGRYVLIPTSDHTFGHGTHSHPEVWGSYLAEFLRTLPRATPTAANSPPASTSRGAAAPHESRDALLLDPANPEWRTPAPPVSHLRFETTRGTFVLELERAWGPIGADRLYNLARLGYFNDTRFHRVHAGYIVQFGINGNPAVNAAWNGQSLEADPPRSHNARGTFAFAYDGPGRPDSRDTQIYINLADNTRNDREPFTVLGTVVEGMSILDSLYSGYGERSGGGMRQGKQGPLLDGGNGYLDREFPRLDRILRVTIATPPRLAPTPPMGWNSWNHFGCDVNEQTIRETADAMASSGMRDAGYRYVVIDDCWQVARDSTGTLVADPQRFPHGIKALADYVHAKGLRFGIYTDAGTNTCQGRPGTLGHEEQDARTFAGWGVDYVKEDWCHARGLDAPTQYRKFRAALTRTGRPIVLSLCEWGYNQPWEWAPDIGQLWRTTEDIDDTWGSMLSNLDQSAQHATVAGPGGWNDPDMLEVGNGGMTDSEYRAHFSLWAVMAAPLIAGNDLRAMSDATRGILTNREVIAVDQDSLGAQGILVSEGPLDLQVWAKALRDGSRAIVLLNRSADAAKITASFHRAGLFGDSATVRDLWSHKDLGTFGGSFASTVAPHSVVMIRATPVGSRH